MSDEKQPPQPNLREPEPVISTPPEIATSLPSEIAEQTEDENKLFFVDDLRQLASFHVLHGQKGAVVGEHAEVVNGDDVLMR